MEAFQPSTHSIPTSEAGQVVACSSNQLLPQCLHSFIHSFILSHAHSQFSFHVISFHSIPFMHSFMHSFIHSNIQTFINDSFNFCVRPMCSHSHSFACLFCSHLEAKRIRLLHELEVVQQLFVALPVQSFATSLNNPSCLPSG